jgi:F-type H+-transporting ATPase subunit c
MKKVLFLMLAVLAVTMIAPAVYAQGGDKTAAPEGTNWVAIAASFGMALAAFGCAFGQARVAGNSVEGIARNPGAADAIRAAMLLGLVFIETLLLFTLLVVFLKAK